MAVPPQHTLVKLAPDSAYLKQMDPVRRSEFKAGENVVICPTGEAIALESLFTTGNRCPYCHQFVGMPDSPKPDGKPDADGGRRQTELLARGMAFILVGLAVVVLAGLAITLFVQSFPVAPGPVSPVPIPFVTRAGQPVTNPAGPASPSSSSANRQNPVYISVTASLMYLRMGPGQYHPEIPTSSGYPTGTSLQVLGRYGSWFFVQAPDGNQGWVYRGWVDSSNVGLTSIPDVIEIPTSPPPIPTPKPTRKPNKNRYP